MPDLNAQPEAYSAQNLRALEQLARQPAGEKRRELMSRLSDLLTEDVGAYSDEAVDSLGETLVMLLDQVEEDGRVDLSQRVAPNTGTPHRLAKRLATDTSARVAEPVLEKSPVLTDQDLVAIASEHSQDHLLAMSRRSQLSTTVTDAIIDHGSTPVFQAVAGNSGASISEGGFGRLASEAPSDDALAEALSQRTDIPETVAEKVIASLPPVHRTRLKEMWSAHPTRSKALFEDVSREMGQKRLSHRRALIEAKVAVKAINGGSRSLDSAISQFAGSNRLSETAHVIASIARLPEKFVRAALLRQDGTAIALVCRSIGLNDASFEEITRMRSSQLALEASNGHQLLQAFRSMDVVSARKTVQFGAARIAAENA